MRKVNLKREARERRHRRARCKIRGVSERPRLNLYRGLRNLYAQIVDDGKSHVLVSCSTINKEIKKDLKYGGNVKAAMLLGEMMAEKAKKAGITKVVFDRGGCRYHGRIRAFAEAARKAGLTF